MIEAQTLINKLGKQGAVEFIKNNKSNQPTAHDKTRGIRGRVRWRRCEHGVYIIDDYQPKPCKSCMGVSANTKLKDFKPYFNIGLGCYVESRSEEKSIAKSKGYQEAG